MEGDFFQDLATQIDKASAPIRAMYHTGPNLAEYVQAAKAAGIKTVADVTRVGRRALEDIREVLAEEPGFKEKERLFRARELEFKAAEDSYLEFVVSGLGDSGEKLKQAESVWDIARREVADVRRDAVRKIVGKVVPLGGVEPFIWYKNFTPREVQESFTRVARLLPKPWLASHRKNGDVMVGSKVAPALSAE